MNHLMWKLAECSDHFGGSHAGRFLCHLSPAFSLHFRHHGSVSFRIVEVNEIENRKGKCNKKKG